MKLYSLIVVAIFAGACAGVESSTPTGPTSAAWGNYIGYNAVDGSARVSTLSVIDQPHPNQCSTEDFKINLGAPEADGTVKVEFSMRPGDGVRRFETQYQRRDFGPMAGPDTYGMFPMQRGNNGETSIINNYVKTPGHYRGQMRGAGCANWSSFGFFTVPGSEPEPEPEPEKPVEWSCPPSFVIPGGGCNVPDEELPR